MYDEDDLRLAQTKACCNPTEAFAEARKIVDGKIEGPKTTTLFRALSERPVADFAGTRAFPSAPKANTFSIRLAINDVPLSGRGGQYG